MAHMSKQCDEKINIIKSSIHSVVFLFDNRKSICYYKIKVYFQKGATMKKKTVKKILITVIILFLVAVLAFFANAFFGNPVSKALAKNSAEKYIALIILFSYPLLNTQYAYLYFTTRYAFCKRISRIL